MDSETPTPGASMRPVRLDYAVCDLQSATQTFRERLGMVCGAETRSEGAGSKPMTLGKLGSMSVRLVETGHGEAHAPPDRLSGRLFRIGYEADAPGDGSEAATLPDLDQLGQMVGVGGDLVESNATVESGIPNGHLEGVIGSLFQLGFVVRDMDSAIAAMSGRLGLSRFKRLSNLRSGQFGRNVKVDAALAYWGDCVIELIQPELEVPSIYRGYVPDDPANARFHHLGFLASGARHWKAVKQALERFGWPVCIRFSNEAVDCLYVDAREDLGHYVECVFRKPAGWALYESVPRN